MSERTAQNSEINKNVEQENNDKSINNRKRKNINMVNGPSTSKQNRYNYYAVLDTENNEHCDQDVLKKFENHVKEYKERTETLNSAITALGDTQRVNKNISTAVVNNKTNNTRTVVTNDQNKNKKVPPINIVDIETKELIEFIKNGLKIKEFKIKEFRNKKSLFMTTIDDFLKVRAFLEKTKTKFFTFTPKGIKNKTYILKGLDANMSCEEILKELDQFQSNDLQFIKVSQFSTKTSVKNGYNLPIFLVQVTPESNVNQLKNIKALFYRCIKWEQVRRPEIPQCRNCQGFFHSAANCFLPTKCVKCNQDHEKGKCTISTVSADEKDKLYCVLCKKYGHPASYKGCEKYKELQQKLRAKKKTLTETRTKFPNSFTIPDISFSNVLRGNNDVHVNNNNSNNTNNNSFMFELKNMMTNLNIQMANLQKQLNLQASRIDAIFSMVGV